MNNGQLILIPNLLGGDDTSIIAPQVKEIALNLKHYIVESEKSARRYLKKLDRSVDIDAIIWHVLPRPKGKFKSRMDRNEMMEMLMEATMGGKIGLISDAGCPAIADPGSMLVAEAHRQGIDVVPLPGPCSITMALMGSGMNGQSFTFHGYLPIDKYERQQAIRRIEGKAKKEYAAQIFMETPYRNQHLLNDILAVAHPDSKLCIATNISLPDQQIVTLHVKEWKNMKPDIHKKPSVFVLGK